MKPEARGALGLLLGLGGVKLVWYAFLAWSTLTNRVGLGVTFLAWAVVAAVTWPMSAKLWVTLWAIWRQRREARARPTAYQEHVAARVERTAGPVEAPEAIADTGE